MKIQILFLVGLIMAGYPAQAQTEYRAKSVTLQGEIGAQSHMGAIVLQAQVPVYRVESDWVARPSTCNRVECSGTSGDGSSGNWQGFFSAPRAEKPKALANAIKGIGQKTAELVLRAGFFTSKPRSWAEFTQEIETAQRTLNRQGFQGRFSELVLEEYGQENARNLGYYVENSCRVITYPCTVIQEVEREVLAYRIERKVEVRVSGQVLQSFEKDTFRIQVGADPLAVEPTANQTYNRYEVKVSQASQAYSVVKFVGAGRKQVAFPSQASSAGLSNDSDGLRLSGQVQAEYLPAGEDRSSRLELEYKVCRLNWFGGCFQTAVENTRVAIQGANFEVKIPGSLLKKGSKHKVWYTVRRLGSKFYSADGVEQTTDSVVYR